MNIFSTVPLSYAVAALGGEVIIDTVDGPVAQTIKPGTVTDTQVRLRGKGVPSLRDSRTRGDHYVTLVVQTPVKLSARAKELLKEFDMETGDSLGAVERFRAEKNGTSGNNGDEPKKGRKKKGLFS